MNAYKSSYCLALLALLLAFCAGCTERSTATKDEVDDLPRAGSFSWVSTAAIYDTVSAKKPVSMMVVGASWCGWCKLLKSKALRDSTVMGMIDQWFNACIIDGDSDSMIVVGDSIMSCYKAVREVFRVPGYPTTIFFNHNATKSVSCPGYYEPDQYANLLYRAYNSLKAE
jgi:thioredoxin-related protein